MTTVSASGRRGRRLAAALGVVLSATLLTTACGVGDDAVTPVQGNQFVSPDGKTVIEYAPGDRRTIGKLEGEDLMGDGTIKLSDYKDKVVVVNVWASWCPPCRTEFRDLENVYAKTRDSGVEFLGIDFRDSRNSAKDFVSDRDVPYRSIYDYGGATLAALGVPVGVVPTTVVLDRSHRPAKVFLRAISEDELTDAVEKIAAESPAKR